MMKRLLGLTRYVVVVPALASILGALLLMAKGSLAMVLAAVDSIQSRYGLKETIVEVLTAIDAILLGTVLLVIGYGLYELFIDTDIDVPMWLRVEDLDDLKSKLIGVVVAIIAVVFVGVFVDSNRADDVISYGVGAGALVAGSEKLVEHFEDGRVELYDLAADPGEREDLAAARSARAAELHGRLAAWRQRVGAVMPSPNPEPREPFGPSSR